MWFTILNRKDIDKNLFRKGMIEFSNIKTKNVILGYAYVADLCNKSKDNIFDIILRNLIKSGAEKILIIGCQGNRQYNKEEKSEETKTKDNSYSMINHIKIAKELERISCGKVSIIVIKDINECYHKKMAIRYDIKSDNISIKPKVAILGSSNFTFTTFYETNDITKYVQKNIDIMFGEKSIIDKMSVYSLDSCYKKVIKGMGEKFKSDDIKKLSEKSVSMNIESQLNDIIKDLEFNLKNFYDCDIEYISKNCIKNMLIDNINNENLQYSLKILYKVCNKYYNKYDLDFEKEKKKEKYFIECIKGKDKNMIIEMFNDTYFNEIYGEFIQIMKLTEIENKSIFDLLIIKLNSI